jgi:hypothetical protein
MTYLIDTHPRRAQWVAGLMTMVLTAALTWITEPGRPPLRAYLLEPLAGGVAVFFAMGYLARRRARRREQI